MNLQWRHLLPIILGGSIGSGLGWLVSCLVKPGVFPEADSTIGLHATGILFGGIIGVGLSALVVVVRAARDPKAGPPSYFMRLHGMGSTLIGHSDPREDGSYVTTEWFTFSYIPLFPVCRYRVTEQQNHIPLFSPHYIIHEKLPVRFEGLVRVYLIGLIVLVGLILFLGQVVYMSIQPR